MEVPPGRGNYPAGGTTMKVVAVILAGGVGTRVGGAVPKQLLTLAGRTVLEHVVDAFTSCELIDETLVTMHADHVDEARQVLGASVEVIAGGVYRHDSTHIALQAIGRDDAIVLIHDAARPLVTADVIQRCVDAARKHDAVSTVVPMADTVYHVTESGLVDAVLERETLRRAQTPQAFRLHLIRQAHEAAQESGESGFTDDCDVMRRFAPATPVHVVDGDEQNFKITGPTDLALAETLLAARHR